MFWVERVHLGAPVFIAGLAIFFTYIPISIMLHMGPNGQICCRCRDSSKRNWSHCSASKGAYVFRSTDCLLGIYSIYEVRTFIYLCTKCNIENHNAERKFRKKNFFFGSPESSAGIHITKQRSYYTSSSFWMYHFHSSKAKYVTPSQSAH